MKILHTLSILAMYMLAIIRFIDNDMHGGLLAFIAATLLRMESNKL